MKRKEVIVIGESDYSREEMGSVNSGIGSSSTEFLNEIKEYEDLGYIVKFKTSIFRRIFCLGVYKVIAYKETPK